MLNVEEAVYDTYMKNITYLKEEQKELYKTLQVLDMAINSGDYESKFELEYRDGYFEIIQLESGRPLYGKNSLEMSQNLVKHMSKSKESYAFEAVPTTNYSKELVEEAEDTNAMILLSEYTRNLDVPDGTMEEIEKYILIGVGLGVHIPYIHNALYPKYYMIIEDNLEIFRLSLFTTKYYELAKAAELSFSVADEVDSFSQKFSLFLEENYMYNRFIKYFHFPFHGEEKIKYIKNILVNQGFITYTYTPRLGTILRPLEYLNDGYKSLDVFNTNMKENTLREKPILVLAAGPSFEKNLQWLKEHQNRFFIIAVSAVLPTLYKENIVPDIVTHIDASDLTLKFYDAIDLDFLQNTMMMFASQVSEKLRQKFPKNRIVFLEDEHGYIHNIGTLSAPCVGSTSALLAVSFYSQEIYLLGLDLAFDQKTGATHAASHEYSKNIALDNAEDTRFQITMDEEILSVDGNFQEKVYTNPRLLYSASALNKLLPQLKKAHQTIYNLSDGVAIEATVAKQTAEIEIDALSKFKKEEKTKALQDLVANNSVSMLDTIDIQNLHKKVAYTRDMEMKIEQHKHSKDTEYKHYLYNLLGLILELSPEMITVENKALASVFDDFSRLILPIVFDFFNTQEIENKEEHIEKIQKIIIDDLENICITYREKIESFLNHKV